MSLQRSAQSLSKQWLAKRGLCLLRKIAQPKKPWHSPPRRWCLLWSLLFEISWRLQSESVNLISQLGGKMRARIVSFFPCTVLTLSLFSVHLSLFFLLLLSHPPASISLGWAPAPSVSQQSKHWGLTLPLLSCFSLIPCSYSRLFWFQKRCFNNLSWAPIIMEVCMCLSVQRGCVSYDNLTEDDIIESKEKKIRSSTALPKGYENTLQNSSTVPKLNQYQKLK